MTWTEPHTMTARCPEDLLAMVPVTLGFTPTDSVAMLTFGAAHPFHARVDLPTRRDEIPELVDALMDPACRNGVHRVVLVFFSDDEVAVRRAWHAMRQACRDLDIEVLEALRADGRRWFPLLHGDRRLRDLGMPYDVSNHHFLAEAVLRGQVLRGSRAELVQSLAPAPDGVAAVRAAVQSRPARPTGSPPEHLLAEGTWIEGMLRHHLARRSSPGDDDVARLLLALTDLRLREAARSLIEPKSAVAFVDLFTDVVRRAPGELAAPPAALLGWAAWQSGHGALAWCAVEVALAADPDYDLCAQLADLLDNAVPPSEWHADPDWASGLTPRAG